jgi:hypothetical protein
VEPAAIDLLWSLDLSSVTVKDSAMAVLFNVAGVALLAHLAICWLLQRSLAISPGTLEELFAIPNRGLGNKSKFQLLRISYYFPWKSVSRKTEPMDTSQKFMLRLAQITGMLVPLCILTFFALAAYRALG